MEVIDLDKVLDDFELSEGNSSHVVPGKEVTPTGLQQYLEKEENLQSLNFYEDGTDTRVDVDPSAPSKLPSGVLYDIPCNSIDIDEADFGPAVPRNQNLIVQEIEASKFRETSLSDSTSVSANDDEGTESNISKVPGDLGKNGVIVQDDVEQDKSLKSINESVYKDDEEVTHTNGELESNFELNHSRPLDNEMPQSGDPIPEKVDSSDVSLTADESMPALVSVAVSEPQKRVVFAYTEEENRDDGSCAASSDMCSDSEVSMSLSEVPSSSGQSDNMQVGVSPEMSTETSPAHTTMDSEPTQAGEASSPVEVTSSPESSGLTSSNNSSKSVIDINGKTSNSCDPGEINQNIAPQTTGTEISNHQMIEADESVSGHVSNAVGFDSDDDIEDGDIEAYFSDMLADNAMLSNHSECQAAKSEASDVKMLPSQNGDVSDLGPHDEYEPDTSDTAVPHVTDSNAHGDVHESAKGHSALSTEPPEETACDDKVVIESLPADEMADSSNAQGDQSRDENVDSVEKFLSIPLASPIVATPMEESGFSKVPGYVPEVNMSSLVEEEPSLSLEEFPSADLESCSYAVAESAADSLVIQTNDIVSTDCPVNPIYVDTKESKPISLTLTPMEKENTPPCGASGPSSLDSDPGRTLTGIGARPKDPNFAKKNRPNTLLGLSKPDLNLGPPVSQDPEPMVVEAVVPENENRDLDSYPHEVYDNSHDVINRQLAQNKRSPMRKKQLNLEIQQQLNEERALDEHRMIDNKMMEAEALIQGEIPVDRYRRKELSPVSDDSSGPAFQAGVEPSLSLPPPGSFEAGKQRRPNTLNIIPNSGVTTTPDDQSPSDDPGSASSAGHTPYMPQESSVSSGFGSSGLEAGPGAFSPPLGSANLNVSITQLGKVAPHWVPDAEAPNCMECSARFTFTKRRHHCRACGKVFCSACCNLKCKLHYMDNKEARVCSKCYQDIVRAQAYERLHSPTGLAGPDVEGGSGSGNRSPNPNNPSEYCSTVPPLQQAQASLHAPPPTVMVPVGVLRKEGNSHEFESSTSPSGPKVEQGSQRNREPKQVMFSDGIRPGGDLTELDGSSQPRTLMRKSGRSARKVERNLGSEDKSLGSNSTGNSKAGAKTKKIAEVQRSVCLIPDKGLPPVILSTGVKGDYSVEENPDPEKILPQIASSDASPVVFAINKNLYVLVKIVNLACCVNRTCWCFTTQGMCTVGQDEMVIVLECLPDEKTIPRDIFCHFNSVYEEAGKGNTVSHLGHTIFGQSFLESKDHCGFLYIRPSFQCLQKLSLPPAPYIFGILLQRWETPWAKVFPLRLMLRLGAEFRYYPCPLISVRFRKPVYGEIGHTIMNLLADFNNFQYMLPQIKGVVIHMEDKKTFINFPKNKYDEVMKVINNSNDHVMALGANFSMDADSHLVCIQNEEGNYQTQAINIQNKIRKVTGASFVVFNGALKTSSGLRGKSSIVEDGLMVQITPESMASLKQALRDMKDYTIGCGSLDILQPEEQVFVQWIEEDRNINVGVKSPIDAMRMDGIESVHIHLATDYVGENHRIRWTEVFFIENDEPGNTRCEPVDLSRLADTLAKATCVALTGHLDKLKEAGLTRIGLRATIDVDKVGYEVGAGGEKLPDLYMNDLDNELIPVIHNAASNSQNGSVILELIFHIIE